MSINLKHQAVSTSEFSPGVLKCNLFQQGMNFPQGYRLEPRYVYDYELEFFIESSGAILIEDRIYPVKKGDIVFRKPGQYAQGIMPYCCYLIVFDLLGNSGKSFETYDFSKSQDFQTYYDNDLLKIIPPVFNTPFPEKYNHLFDSALNAFIRQGAGSDILLKSYVLQILYQLFSDIGNPLSASLIPMSAHYSILKRIVDHIKLNIHKKLSLDVLSGHAGLSPSHFHKIFTNAMGVTPNEFISKTRLEKAKELLIKTDVPIGEIALQCGYENIPYFSYAFKKQLNLSPGEFRRKHSYV